jgi:hypothetical protein
MLLVPLLRKADASRSPPAIGWEGVDPSDSNKPTALDDDDDDEDDDNNNNNACLANLGCRRPLRS